ncbi:MAG TPA: hypothetical protein VNT01_08715 [Symbiobacteriaceae bacterium]|nr:hypothetical protein [Symbiobacteriaceae bacterium]
MPYRMSVNIGAAGLNPWMAGISGVPAAAAPIAAAPTTAGGCTTAYGPVANVCQSSVPVTQMVPVTRQVPVTSVTPIPNSVAPQVSVAGMPTGQPLGKGAMPYGKGAAMPYGKGAMAPYGKAAPLAAAPGMMPGIYTQDAWITGV